MAQLRSRYFTQGSKAGQIKDTRLLYLHSDQLDTPRYATNQSQTVVWRWDSDAWGQGRPESGLTAGAGPGLAPAGAGPEADAEEDGDAGETDSETVRIALRLPGQLASDGGLHYNFHRDYEPATGRYAQSDPIGLAGGVNTYVYVFGNPLRWIDPLGLFCTSDFTKHYYTGGGSTIDLGAVGLLGAFQNSASVQGAVGDFKQKASSAARVKASSLCKNCDKGTKSTSFNLEDTAETNVTGEPCLFAVGGSTFFRNAACGVTANCDNRIFSFGCSLGFSIRDWFRDPIDLGIELPGGTPYRINAGWSESYSGSGSF